MTEVLAFITGGVCVWLIVKQNIWNWPIGIANDLFFVVLFLQARLFADMSLQVVYVVLGFLGWFWWLRGGHEATALTISRVSRAQSVLLAILAVSSTYGGTLYLRSVNDSAPFLDALTTVLSLIAQYMLTRKYLENWWVWISADVIYIGLYAYKHLYLTSALYGIFLSMCIVGLLQWTRSIRHDRRQDLALATTRA
ncbi:MAG TPA: nicotinamide riboside transporter PnuC [Candidatus Eremiobacteraceae bacterium]